MTTYAFTLIAVWFESRRLLYALSAVVGHNCKENISGEYVYI